MSDPSVAELPVTVRFTVGSDSLTATASIPTGQVRIDQVLPLLWELDNQAIDHAVGSSEQAGKPISCCRGCAACCKAQPVPVTPVESYALARLVERLPEPRQSAIRARFAERVERLRAAGLADVFLRRDPNISKDDARQVARRYFNLGLACPFLEEDACGIYHDRPLICRQYLVTSRAELCSDPLSNPVEVLPVPLAGAGAVLKAASRLLGRDQFTVPLVLALEYVAEHRAELERTFAAQEVVNECLSALFAGGAGDDVAEE